MAKRGSHKLDEENLQPAHLELARALISLRRSLIHPQRIPSLAEISQRLDDEAGYPASVPLISKYLRLKEVPPAGFIKALHQLASSDAGPGNSLRAVGELLELRAGDCSCSCPKHPASANRSTIAAPVNLSAMPSLDVTLSSQKPAHLPVPHMTGDRQRIDSVYPAAANIAEVSAQLLADGKHEAALAVLNEVPERLGPTESAACLVLLRRQHQPHLADTLMRLYIREQPDKDVMRFAAELHAHGQMDDVGTTLWAAVS
jgi:hypothetical protein